MSEYNFNGSFESINSEEKPQADNIAAWVKRVVDPDKVIDLGCGPGTYVYSLRDQGIEAFGYDLDPRVKGQPFLEHKNILEVKDQGDVVMCIEVAEHIEPKFSQDIVDKVYDTLKEDGVLIWTAAHLGQGGVDHINCRPKEYWEKKFKDKGLIRCQTLENQLLTQVKQSIHLGWFTMNLLVFYKA